MKRLLKVILFIIIITGTLVMTINAQSVDEQDSYPIGAPSYTKITQGGKTLKDANLMISEGDFNVEGTVKWLLDDTTIVEYNKEYTWIFTPTSASYNTISGEIRLFTNCITHTYSNNCDINCNICGDNTRVPLDHSYIEIERIEPTKEADGQRTIKCQECGFEKIEAIPKLKLIQGWQIALIVIVLIVIVGVATLAVCKKKQEKRKKSKKRKK